MKYILTFLLTSGAIIGLNAALISIITVWLSDLKLGYCTQGWWLNRKFCCWEMVLNSSGGCEDWQTWTSWSGIQWGFYVGIAVRTSLSAAPSAFFPGNGG